MANFAHELLSLLTLLFLEIVLGIDNLIFVSVASQKLPKSEQRRARQMGLFLALFTRIALLGSLTWLSRFTTPLFTIANITISLKDILLTLGGLFLIYKGTDEIHAEFKTEEEITISSHSTFFAVICQIAILDIVFSLDSVVTAIGMTQAFYIMALAITIAIFVMIFAAEKLSDFIEKNQSIKVLAISFILMVGMVLIADGFHFYIPRAYIYFSISFSLFVETINILLRNKKSKA